MSYLGRQTLDKFHVDMFISVNTIKRRGSANRFGARTGVVTGGLGEVLGSCHLCKSMDEMEK